MTTTDRTPTERTALVTGASAGIGEATARVLAREGFHLVVAARRVDRLRRLAEEVGGEAHELDVTDAASVHRLAGLFARRPLHLLVNNAGAAFGLDPIAEAVEERWRAMYEVNVLGVLRTTRALLPALERAAESGGGHVVNVGSTSGFETYPGGAGYTATKHALRALTRTLRMEVAGRPIRVTDVSPGLVETEFSRVRFPGEPERAEAVYRGMTPLAAEDVAECIAFAATRPPHVDVDEIVVRPRDQVSSTWVHREES